MADSDKPERWLKRDSPLALLSTLAFAIFTAAAGVPQPAGASPRSPQLSRSGVPSSPPNTAGEEEETWGGEQEHQEQEEAEAQEEAEGESQAAALPPAKCLLRSAAADILASATSDRVTLTVRYSTYAPSDVTVGYWLKGTRGALQLGTEREHFAATGLVHLSERLDAGAMAKARAARAFIVSLKVPAAPAYCDRYAIRRLTLRRVRDGQTEWLRPNSASG